MRDILLSLPEPAEYFAGRDGWFTEPPRNILVFARKSPSETMDGGLHVHPRFVFCWCVEGGGSIMVDGALLSLEEGQGLLLFPFQQHHFSSFRGLGFLWVFVSFELENTAILGPLRLRPAGLGGWLLVAAATRGPYPESPRRRSGERELAAERAPVLGLADLPAREEPVEDVALASAGRGRAPPGCSRTRWPRTRR